MIVSSIRFRNSGRKFARNASITWCRISASEVDVRAHDVGRPEIARHNDDRVPEIDRSALAVRQSAIVKDLQQDVEDFRVRLFDFVEQYDASRDAGERPRKVGRLPHSRHSPGVPRSAG